MKDKRLALQVLFLVLSGNAGLAFLQTAPKPAKRAAQRTWVDRRHAFVPRPKPKVETSTQLHFDVSFLHSTIPVLQNSAFPQFLQQVSDMLFLSPATTSMTTAHMIQTAGEASFAGMIAIAAVQGAMVMRQYATNPNGGLIVPPGLTEGDEDASTAGDTKILSTKLSSEHTLKEPTFVTKIKKCKAMTDCQVEAAVCDTEDTEISCGLKKTWFHATTQVMAVALVPVAAIAGPSLGLAAWMMRYGHLLHMGVIFGLAHIFDFFRKLPDVESCTASRTTGGQLDETTFASSDHPRILVLGDSMGVGIGSCEIFDPAKVYDIPLHKEEHLAETGEELEKQELPGPVFPKALASALSQRLGKPVSWRSAGVDGGSTEDIAEHLLGVVQDEVNKGTPPAMVVVLSGSNDLKHIINIGGDRSASVKGFRSNLMQLAQQIQTISPDTKVVYPSLPTYRLDHNSILNIFPLSVFLDSIIGFWDAQKKTVAEQCPGVIHVGLKVSDVNSWYKTEDGEEVSLIAADGIHPNARCYEQWGSFVANSLADKISATQRQTKTPKHTTNKLTQHNLKPGYSGVHPAFKRAWVVAHQF